MRDTTTLREARATEHRRAEHALSPCWSRVYAGVVLGSRPNCPCGADRAAHSSAPCIRLAQRPRAIVVARVAPGLARRRPMSFAEIAARIACAPRQHPAPRVDPPVWHRAASAIADLAPIAPRSRRWPLKREARQTRTCSRSRSTSVAGVCAVAEATSRCASAAPAWCPRSRADLRSPRGRSSRSRSAASRGVERAKDRGDERAAVRRHRGQPQRRAPAATSDRMTSARCLRAHRPLIASPSDRIPTAPASPFTQSARAGRVLSFHHSASARGRARIFAVAFVTAPARAARAPRSHRFRHRACALDPRGAIASRASSHAATLPATARGLVPCTRQPRCCTIVPSGRRRSMNPHSGTRPAETERGHRDHLRRRSQRKLCDAPIRRRAQRCAGARSGEHRLDGPAPRRARVRAVDRPAGRFGGVVGLARSHR